MTRCTRRSARPPTPRSSTSRTHRQRRSSSRSSCAARRRWRSHDTTVFVDGIPALAAVRPPSRWAASIGRHPRRHRHDGWRTRGCDARRFATAARGSTARSCTRSRTAPACGWGSPSVATTPRGSRAVDLTAVPAADAVARGWRAQLEPGDARRRCPTPRSTTPIDAARAQLLLAGQAWRADPQVFAALEDWGFDDEALAAWARLGMLDRRRSRRARAPCWYPVVGRACAVSRRRSRAPAELLLMARDLLVRDDDSVDLGAVRVAGRLARPAARRPRRPDAAGPGVVLGAVARGSSGAAVGGAPGRHAARAGARSGVVHHRAAGRNAPRAAPPDTNLRRRTGTCPGWRRRLPGKVRRRRRGLGSVDRWSRSAIPTSPRRASTTSSTRRRTTPPRRAR